MLNVISAEQLLKLLGKFEQISGLVVNSDKTEAMWLGSLKNSKDNPLGLKWSNILKGLGVYFSYDKEKAEIANFKPKIRKLMHTFNFWKLRNLSMTGKILIMKSLGISQLTYLASVIEVPDWVYKEVVTLLFNFL